MAKFNTFKFGTGVKYNQQTESFTPETSTTVSIMAEGSFGYGFFGEGFFGVGRGGALGVAFTEDTSTTISYTGE